MISGIDPVQLPASNAKGLYQRGDRSETPAPLTVNDTGNEKLWAAAGLVCAREPKATPILHSQAAGAISSWVRASRRGGSWQGPQHLRPSASPTLTMSPPSSTSPYPNPPIFPFNLPPLLCAAWKDPTDEGFSSKHPDTRPELLTSPWWSGSSNSPGVVPLNRLPPLLAPLSFHLPRLLPAFQARRLRSSG